MTDVRDRTPFVIIELQLRPHVPDEAEPYWWGIGTLDFRVPDAPCIPQCHRDHPHLGPGLVWRGELGSLTQRSSEAARVEKRDYFGWVLILTLTHDEAKDALKRLNLPQCAYGLTAPVGVLR